jgi:hypothetical protein
MPESFPSPDGSKKIIWHTITNRIFFAVQEGNEPAVEVYDTRSRYRSNVEWVSNEKFAILNSDIGQIGFSKKSGSWKQTDLQEYQSPNGRYIANCRFAYSDPETSVIEIRDGNRPSSRTPTHALVDGFFEVDLMKECITWTSDTSFVVQTLQGKSTVSQGRDGRWVITEQTP